MGNKQSKEEDQLTDSDAVSKPIWSKQQTEPGGEPTHKGINHSILENKQMNLEDRLAVSVGEM